MDNLLIAEKAIQAVTTGKMAYCKFLSANDTGDTGAHQAGIYIAKNAIPILFDSPGLRGENKDRYVKIRWQDDFITECRFIYYGVGTRNEYRITRFGKGFPFLRTEHTGDLFVFIRLDDDDYSAYILQTEDEINEFLNAFGMSPIDTGSIIQKDGISSETHVELAIMDFIQTLEADFPASVEMSAMARKIYHQVFDHKENIINDPDKHIVSWTEMEYHLFRKLELFRYGDMIARGFNTVDQFIEVANMVLNRRKSRAGKSLEHHLSAIFDGNNLAYESQPRTEGKKRPDFLFPSEALYHNASWSADRLVFLGAKTTCKDRWRQIINEANRIEVKHLFTLQQGISAQQLDEMAEEKVILVVPRVYLETYPREKRKDIWTLKKFISYTREKTGIQQVDIKSPEERSLNMSKIKNKHTKPEMYIRSLLHRLGLRYRVNCSELPGKPDLYFSGKRVAVFVHGCYWHRHPGCKYAYTPKSNQEFWIPKLEGNRRHDENVIMHLQQQEIRVLIIWECTVKLMIRDEMKCNDMLNAVLNFINDSDKTILEL